MKNRRLTLIYVITCIVILCGCTKTKKPVTTPNNAIIIDWDVSVSVGFDSTNTAAYLTKLVESQLTQSGDRLLLISTGNSGYGVDQIKSYSLHLPSTSKPSNELTAIRARKAHAKDLSLERKKLLNAVLGDMFSGKRDDQTHILASLATIRDAIETIHDHQVNLYLLSDLVEDSPIRSFYQSELTNVQQAIDFANTDAQVLKVKYGLGNELERLNTATLVNPSCLGGNLRVRKDAGFLVKYWSQVLDNLGVNSVKLETNCP